MRKETFKNADYPNAIPAWMKRGFRSPVLGGNLKSRKPPPKTQLQRVFEKLDWEKLSQLGKKQCD